MENKVLDKKIKDVYDLYEKLDVELPKYSNPNEFAQKIFNNNPYERKSTISSSNTNITSNYIQAMLNA